MDIQSFVFHCRYPFSMSISAIELTEGLYIRIIIALYHLHFLSPSVYSRHSSRDFDVFITSSNTDIGLYSNQFSETMLLTLAIINLHSEFSECNVHCCKIFFVYSLLLNLYCIILNNRVTIEKRK